MLTINVCTQCWETLHSVSSGEACPICGGMVEAFIRASVKEHPGTIPQPVLDWLHGIDTGISSKAIVSIMENVPVELVNGRWGYGDPLDPADLGRCIRLLEIMPDYRARLPEMSAVSPQWAALVNHWDELAALYHEEWPAGRAPRCSARL